MSFSTSLKQYFFGKSLKKIDFGSGKEEVNYQRRRKRQQLCAKIEEREERELEGRIDDEREKEAVERQNASIHDEYEYDANKIECNYDESSISSNLNCDLEMNNEQNSEDNMEDIDQEFDITQKQQQEQDISKTINVGLNGTDVGGSEEDPNNSSCFKRSEEKRRLGKK